MVMGLLNTALTSLVKATELSLGGDEQTNFELMIADLVQWFIDNPTPTWKRELSVASNAPREMSYRY